jgi:hypothetical protein
MIERKPATKNTFEFKPGVPFEEQDPAVMLGIEKDSKTFLFGGLSIRVTGLQKYILDNAARMEVMERIISFYGIDPKLVSQKKKMSTDVETNDVYKKETSKFYAFYLMNLLSMNAEFRREIFSNRYYVVNDLTDYAKQKIKEFRTKSAEYFFNHRDADPEIAKYLKIIEEDGIPSHEIFLEGYVPAYFVHHGAKIKHGDEIELRQALKEIVFGLSKDRQKSLGDFVSARRKPIDIKRFLTNTVKTKTLNPKLVEIIKQRRNWP